MLLAVTDLSSLPTWLDKDLGSYKTSLGSPGNHFFQSLNIFFVLQMNCLFMNAWLPV